MSGVDPRMAGEVDFYDGLYGHLAADPLLAVRRETYDEDHGQASWITLAEAREWFRLLGIGSGQTALEVACGSGGITCRMAVETGATCVGVDINTQGIEAARARAREQALASQVSFQVVDAGQRLPFHDESFDAIFCNDSINHFPGRSDVLRDWHRGLRRDVTEAVASISRRWRDARSRRRAALVDLEGPGSFESLQRFLDAVYTLASERRLSRYMYVASKPPAERT